METIAAQKKTIIGAKVSNEEKGRILERCSALKCNTTDYIKKLIDKDLAWPTEGNLARIKIEGDKIFLPCIHCGGSASVNLSDLGLRHT
jgi:hypothetical protein